MHLVRGELLLARDKTTSREGVSRVDGIAIGAVIERGLAELIKFQWKAKAAERSADGQAAEQGGSGGAASLGPRISHSAQDR